MLLEAVVRPRPKLVQVPTRFGHADDRHVEVAAFDHRLQRRKNLLVGQIARGAEENQGVGMEITHCQSPFRATLFAGRFLQMSAEAVAHRREQLVLIIRLTARGEALIERGGENRAPARPRRWPP